MIARAQQAFDEQRYRPAVLDLKEVLKSDPQNAKARWLLAETYLAIYDGASAAKELERARSLGVSDDAVLPALAHALLMQGKGDAVLALEAKGQVSAASAGELAAYQSLAQLEKGEMVLAEAMLDRAVASAPKNAAVRYAQARLAASEKRFDDVLQLTDGIIKDFPDYAPAWSLRGDLFRIRKLPSAAEEAYSAAIAHRPLFLRDRENRGYARVALGKWDDVKADGSDLVALAPSFQPGHFLVGLSQYEKGELQLAQESLERSLALDPDHLLTIFLLANLDGQLGNLNRSRQLAEQAVSRAPGFPAARMQMAMWHLRDRDGAAAEEMVRPIVDQMPENQHAMHMLAASLLMQGKADDAVRIFQKLADKKDGSGKQQLVAGLGLLSAGDVSGGVSMLSRLAAESPENPVASSALISGYVQQQAYQEALEAAKRFLQHRPGDPVAVNLLAMAQLAAGENLRAVESFEEALRLDPGNRKASQMLARNALEQKEFATAMRYIDAGVAKHPGDPGLLMLQAMAAKEIGDVALQESALLSAVDANPRQPSPRVQLAWMYLERNEPEKALGYVVGDFVGRDPGILLARANAFRRLNRPAEARAPLETLVQLLPNSVDLQFALLDVYDQLKERANAERTLDSILVLEPENVKAKLAKARYALAAGDLQEARRTLSALGEVAFTEANGLLSWVVIAQRDGDHAQEAVYARKLFELEPSTMHAVMFSRALRRAEVPSQARDVLKDWVSTRNDDVVARAELSDYYLEAGDVPSSVSELRQILSTDPENVNALNNLGWHLRTDSPVEALEFARRAHQLAPDSPPVLDTLAMAYAANQDFANALRFIQKAIDSDAGVSEFRLHRAEIRYRSGDQEGAVSDLKSLLRERVSDETRGAAEAMLAKLEP